MGILNAAGNAFKTMGNAMNGMSRFQNNVNVNGEAEKVDECGGGCIAIIITICVISLVIVLVPGILGLRMAAKCKRDKTLHILLAIFFWGWYWFYRLIAGADACK